MRVHECGDLHGPVLAFGGPYSNLQATQALLAEAERRGVSGDRLICTGDVVAYCAGPVQTVAAIRASGAQVVAGNMEISLGAGADACGCGFEAGTACDVMAGAWFAYADAAVGSEDRAWMGACPDWITFRHAGRRCAVVHGAASDVARFLWPTTDTGAFAREWEVIESQIGPIDLVISGHSGVPFLRNLPFGTWLNAGVIGMPPHDGSPETRFAVLAADGAISIEMLAYDHIGAAQAMQAAGLTQGYDRALRTGYWPSEDVLPPDLRVPSRASG